MEQLTQAEALRLAHYFDQPLPPEWEDMKAAAKELRRLHAENESLRSSQAAELKFLIWFYINADFGPADDDVRNYLRERYEDETGEQVPPGYRGYE